MSKLAQFRDIQRQMEELQKAKDKLQGSEELQNEIKFSDDLKALMEEYGKSSDQVLRILLPDMPVAKAPARARKQRVTKLYINPHTGDEIATKGGNHKLLKEWKAEYGADVVESWLQANEENT